MYRQLVTDPNDAVGAFAYILYKQEKIAFIEAIKQSQGREPTLEELRTFHTRTCTQPRIDSYIKISVATILVIGALLGGYQALSRFNAILEQVLQLAPKESVPDPAQTGQPSRPPAPSPSD